MKKRDNKEKKNKNGQFHFAWIFAIIIGAIILFLTFFFLGQQIFLGEYKEKVEEVHGLDLLLGPFSYLGSITEASSDEIVLNKKTQLSFDCKDLGLGYNILMTGEASHDIHDKYIFAEDMTAKKITLISKPFKMPFRVADLIYLALTDEDRRYCFVNAPLRIENELNNLDIGFEFENSAEQCETGSVKICFDVSGYCDVKVRDRSDDYSYSYGEVIKNGDKMFFVKRALLYGAIFSSKNVYDCNLKRLMTRLDLLITIYKQKNIKMEEVGCEENYHAALGLLDNEVNDFDINDFKSIVSLYEASQNLENLNIGSTCTLY